MASSIMGLGSPSAKKRALGIPSGKARAVSAFGTGVPRSGNEQPPMATMAASNVANTVSLCVTTTVSCANNGVTADNNPVAPGSSGAYRRSLSASSTLRQLRQLGRDREVHDSEQLCHVAEWGTQKAACRKSSKRQRDRYSVLMAPFRTSEVARVR